jgi:hypothetical protein
MTLYEQSFTNFVVTKGLIVKVRHDYRKWLSQREIAMR